MRVSPHIQRTAGAAIKHHMVLNRLLRIVPASGLTCMSVSFNSRPVGMILVGITFLLPGGGLIGVGFGIATRFILRFLQRFGATAEQQIALTLACGYLSFYTANSPAKVSGVHCILHHLQSS
jgi:NhaP-type Na+/H+ or K+/H+ antiporter